METRTNLALGLPTYMSDGESANEVARVEPMRPVSASDRLKSIFDLQVRFKIQK